MSANGSQRDARGRGGAERRYLTVMFIDLVGFTQLSDELEAEDLHALSTRYQQLALAVMERFGGFVANFFGDGVLVYFGYPAAHGNDAERSLRASLELVERISALEVVVGAEDQRRMAVRIGVHSGPVIIGPEVMSAGPISHGVVGKAANLAARLQNEAPPNGVVVSRETMEIVEDAFEFAPLGPRRLKGLANPVEVFQVLTPKASSPSRAASPNRRLSTFVDREGELAEILSRWREACETSRCRVVVVAGDAGLGKSRLLNEFMASPELAGSAVIQSSCHEIFDATALYPVRSYLRRRTGIATDDDAATRRRKLQRLLAEFDLADAESLEIFSGLSDVGAAAAGPSSPQIPSLKLRQFRLLVALIGRLVRDRPTIICLEDAHWLDASTSELLVDLAAALRDARLLILLSTRTFPRGPALPRADAVVRVEPLGIDDCVKLANQMPGAEQLPASAISRAVEASEGAPFFVEQLVRSLIDEETKSLKHRRPSADIPLALAEILAERLDRRPRGRRAALAAACIGRSFKPEFLAAVLREDGAVVAETLEALVEAEVLRPRRYGVDLQFEFTHALLQRMAQDSMLEPERAEMHREIVAALQSGVAGSVAPEVMAFHLTQAGSGEEAIAAWLAAAVISARGSAHVEAIDHIQKGLALLEKVAELARRRQLEVDLLAVLIASISVTQGPTSPALLQSCERGQALCRAANAGAKIFPFIFGQFTYFNCRGQVDEAGALADLFVRIGDEQGYEPAKVVGRRLRGMSLFGAGDVPSAKAELQASLDLYNRARDVAAIEHYGQNARVHSQSLLVLPLFCLGEIEDALALGRDVLRAVDVLRHPNSTALALSYVGCVLFDLSGAHDHQLRAAERLAAVAAEHRLGGFIAHGEGFLGWALCQQGRCDEGVILIERAVRAFDGAEYRLGLSGHLANLAQAQQRLGRGKEAKATIARAIELMKASSNLWLEPELRRIEALIEREFGRADLRECAEMLKQAARRARNSGFPIFERRCLASLTQFVSELDEEMRTRLEQTSKFDKLQDLVQEIVGGPALLDLTVSSK